jgi:hypothetical protein
MQYDLICCCYSKIGPTDLQTFEIRDDCFDSDWIT